MELRQRLTRFFRHRVSSAEDAEDLTQEVFLRAHNAEAQLRDDERFESWLFSIARNALTDFYRRNAREIPHDVMQPQGAPDDDLEVLAELAHCVRPLLTRLPAADREAIEAVDLGGMSQFDFATAQKMSRSGAKSRVQRARRRLHAAFLDCCEVETDARGRPTDVHARRCEC